MRLWGPQEGESAKAFAAFETFRDLGPSRTLREAAGIHYGRSEPSQGEYDTLRRWSARHDWAERAGHFDRWLQLERRDAVQRHVAEKAEDFAARETALRERALEVRERALEKSLMMMKAPLYEQSRRVEDGPSGEEVVYEFHPVRWNLGTAVQLYALSQDGGPTLEDLEQYGDLDFSDLSEDEMLELLTLQDKIRIVPPEPSRRRGRP